MKIDILEKKYDFLISQKKEWPFFLELADYVRFVIKEEETNNIVKDLEEKRRNEREKLRKYEKQTIKEIKNKKEKLFKKIERNKINNSRLDNEINEYQDLESGKQITSEPLGIALSECLTDIIRTLIKNNNEKILKGIAKQDKKCPERIIESTLSENLSFYKKELRKFEETKTTALWFSWDQLTLVFQLVQKKDEKLKNLSEDDTRFYDKWNFLILIQELKKIKEGELNKVTGLRSSFEPMFLKREKFEHHTGRIHHYLIEELNKQEKIAAKKAPKGDIEFDDDKTSLYIKGKECKLPAFKDEHYLCRALYTRLKEEPIDWEILYEEITGSKVENVEKNKKKIRDAVDRLNTRVEALLGVERFVKWENKTARRTR